MVQLEAGELLAVVGASVASKSMLVLLLSCAETRYTDGAAQASRAKAVAALRAELGYASRDTFKAVAPRVLADRLSALPWQTHRLPSFRFSHRVK